MPKKYLTLPKLLERRCFPTEHRQDDDAVGVDEAPPAVPEGMREVIVLRDGAAEARKISEGGVVGQGENDKDRADGQIIKKRRS